MGRPLSSCGVCEVMGGFFGDVMFIPEIKNIRPLVQKTHEKTQTTPGISIFDPWTIQFFEQKIWAFIFMLKWEDYHQNDKTSRKGEATVVRMVRKKFFSFWLFWLLRQLCSISPFEGFQIVFLMVIQVKQCEKAYEIMGMRVLMWNFDPIIVPQGQIMVFSIFFSVVGHILLPIFYVLWPFHFPPLLSELPKSSHHLLTMAQFPNSLKYPLNAHFSHFKEQPFSHSNLEQSLTYPLPPGKCWDDSKLPMDQNMLFLCKIHGVALLQTQIMFRRGLTHQRTPAPCVKLPWTRYQERLQSCLFPTLLSSYDVFKTTVEPNPYKSLPARRARPTSLIGGLLPERHFSHFEKNEKFHMEAIQGQLGDNPI